MGLQLTCVKTALRDRYGRWADEDAALVEASRKAVVSCAVGLDLTGSDGWVELQALAKHL